MKTIKSSDNPAAAPERSKTEKEIWAILETVVDPEIPVLNVVEMGIVRRVVLESGSVTVVITPTYSGCPAMKVIADDISEALRTNGIEDSKVESRYSDVWTTDFMTAEAREKLRKYGIAPPLNTLHPDADLDGSGKKPVGCPYCGSANTDRTSYFGSTACKSMHYCNGCQQPFEAFKCI